MSEVGSAFVSILPSAKGFGAKLNSEVSGDIQKSGKSLGGMFGKAIGVTAVAAAAGVCKTLHNAGSPDALTAYFTEGGA